MSDIPRIIVPGTDTLLLSPDAARSELQETNERIHARIQRLRNVAISRGCSVLKRHARQFSGIAEVQVQDSGDEFFYLDDAYLRSLALQGEQHLCPNHRVLEELFDRRAVLMAAIA